MQFSVCNSDSKLRMVSVSHGRDWVEHTRLVARGQNLSRHKLSVELGSSVAVLISSEENVLKGGKAVATTEAQCIGDRL